MACDSGGKEEEVRPQEPVEGPLLVDAPVQARPPQRRRRRLHAPAHLAAVVMLRRRAPTVDEEQQVHALTTRNAEGSSGETSAPETVLLNSDDEKRRGCPSAGETSFSKKDLGRLCICNGPVEQIQIQGDHGITASLLQAQEYLSAGFILGDGRALLALDIAPMNTRVSVKRPLGTSVDDLLSYLQLQDPKADITRCTGDVDYKDATKEYVSTFLLLVVDGKASPPASVLVEGISTMGSLCTSVVDEALSTQDASSRDPSERREAMLCLIQLLNRFRVEHILGWTSLPPLLDAAMVRDMNTTEMLLRGNSDVHEIIAIGSIGIYWILFVIGTSRTHEPRTVWLQLKNNARIFQGKTYGPIHMAEFQNMCCNENSASMIPWDSSSLRKNQLMNKEGGDWLLDDELDDFGRCYNRPDASTGLVSSIFSAPVAWIKSQGYLKQGAKFETVLEITPLSTSFRVPIKWQTSTSVDDLLSYLQDPKIDKSRGIGEVDCSDAMKGCVMLLLLVVDGNTSPPASVVVEGVSTKMSICNFAVDGALSTHDVSCDPSERRETLLCWIHLFNQFGVENKLDWGSLPPLLNAAKVQDINIIEMLPRETADVNKVTAIGSIELYRFLVDTSSTQEPRTVWLLLKNDARIFKGNTHGPMHMAVFQSMYLNRNSASMISWDSSSIQKNQAMNKEGGDWLLDDELDNFEGCYTGRHAWYSSRKALVIGLKRANQMQPQGIGFIQSGSDKGVVNAKDNMVRKRVDVEDTVLIESLPTELQRATSHSMLDDELSKKHNLHKLCLLPVLHLPSWFFIFRNWLPGFQVVAAKQLTGMCMLSSVRGDVRAKCIMKLSHGVQDYYKPRDLMQFLPSVSKMCVVPVRTGPATSIVYLPLLSQTKSELEESGSDYQYPICPITANITGDSHDIQSQQFEPCCESNNVDSRQGNECRLSNVDSHQDGTDSTKDDSSMIPIFVRHVSGELALTVSLDQSLQHMMHLYAQKTKTKLECQYFVYGRKTLEPDHTFLFYGVERDTTVHVCTRLLGGIVTVGEYLISNKEKFLSEVTLPDGKVSLEMTKEGCLFLSTWLKCFTSAFADSKSWDGNFTMNDFRVTNGHVLVITSPKGMLTSSSMRADMVVLVQYIRTIFYKNNPILVSKFPPYLENLTTFLESMKSPALSPVDRLFIETHMCCVESAARGMLLVWLRRKYKSLDDSDKTVWDSAMRTRNDDKEYYFATFDKLSGVAVFQDVIAHVKNTSQPYTTSKTSTLRLMRDEYMHGPSKRFDKSTTPWKEKFMNDHGIELMIPAYNKDLIPNILLNWIKHPKIDIKSELLAVQVRCTCNICHRSHTGSKGVESSNAGRGKQPAEASSTSSGFSRPASPAQAAANPWFSQPTSPALAKATNPHGSHIRRSFLDAARSASPTLQSSSSSRFSSPSSQDTKGKGKQRK